MMSHIVSRALRSVLFVVVCAPVARGQVPRAQAEASPSTQVDALFSRWHTPDSPGAAVLVMHNGDIVHAKGYGMANLENGIPIRPNTVFDIASVSKQFCAMAILLLVNDGRIALDDDVRKYIPELPDFGHTITIRHLSHHVSGMRDWPGTLRMAGWSFDDVISFDQILRMAFNQRELNFTPGSTYAYSNTGYNLLAEVVRRVSGKSFRAFTDDRIFKPLGMTDTHFHDDYTMAVPRLANSYRRAADGTYHTLTDNLTALGSSSLFTTIEDLARWARNFEQPVVGNAALIARSEERGVLTSGDTIAYAFGQSVGTYRGQRNVSHTGSWAGYRTVLQRFTDARFTVIILANSPEMNPSALATQIADVYLADRLTPRPAVAEGGGRGGAGGRGNAAANRWTPSAAELREYVGTYESAELVTEWVLAIRDDGRLVARHFRAGDVLINPVERDRFQAGMFGEMRFVRDGAGRISGFTANQDRIRGLRFERVR